MFTYWHLTASRLIWAPSILSIRQPAVFFGGGVKYSSESTSQNDKFSVMLLRTCLQCFQCLQCFDVLLVGCQEGHPAHKNLTDDVDVARISYAWRVAHVAIRPDNCHPCSLFCYVDLFCTRVIWVSKLYDLSKIIRTLSDTKLYIFMFLALRSCFFVML